MDDRRLEVAEVGDVDDEGVVRGRRAPCDAEERRLDRQVHVGRAGDVGRDQLVEVREAVAQLRDVDAAVGGITAGVLQADAERGVRRDRAVEDLDGEEPEPGAGGDVVRGESQGRGGRRVLDEEPLVGGGGIRRCRRQVHAHDDIELDVHVDAGIAAELQVGQTLGQVEAGAERNRQVVVEHQVERQQIFIEGQPQRGRVDAQAVRDLHDQALDSREPRGDAVGAGQRVHDSLVDEVEDFRRIGERAEEGHLDVQRGRELVGEVGDLVEHVRRVDLEELEERLPRRVGWADREVAVAVQIRRPDVLPFEFRLDAPERERLAVAGKQRRDGEGAGQRDVFCRITGVPDQVDFDIVGQVGEQLGNLDEHIPGVIDVDVEPSLRGERRNALGERNNAKRQRIVGKRQGLS